MAITHLGASTARALVHGTGEIAFVDVREAGQHGEGHPFFAVNLPYSRLELDARRLMPRVGVPVVLLDAGDDVAQRAARGLEALGYRDLRVLDGGAPAWEAAGFTLFKGVNLPSKAFGEMVEHAMHTPSISAQELVALRERGEDLVVLDGRTPAEFEKMSIPGAQSCPNAELPYRLTALRPGPDTTVVVNCAGRTRSIIGAQGLRSLGLGDRVVALRNGTQGWALAGLPLDHGEEPGTLPEPAAAQKEIATLRARAMLERLGVEGVDEQQVAQWRGDAERSLYLLDVRTEAEYLSGHADGAVHAPGGQLVQATDQWVAVRNARLVLCDEHLVRAASTAMWLQGMGHEVWVMDVWQSSMRIPALPAPDASTCELSEVAQRVAAGARIVDVSPSMAFREAHIAGAVWGSRPRLPALAAAMPGPVLVAGRDAGVAALAAQELVAAGCAEVQRIPGGPAQWQAAGLELSSSPDSPADPQCLDYLFFVHDRHAGNLDAARAYLAWETGLIAQMHEDERAVMTPEVPVLQ